jgi:hypothetical protein
MQATDVRALDAGRRVQVFLDTQAAALGKAVAPSLRAKLDDSVTQLAGFQNEQGTADGAARGATANQAALRDDLFQKFMVPIARAAKIALKNAPELPKLVVSALARRKADFVSTANQFAEAATKDAQVFVDHGMPTDFLTQLQAEIALVTASADAQGRAIARRIAATAGCTAQAKAVKGNIGLLDGVIKPALKGNTALLADWQASKRIRQPAVTPLPTGTTVVAPTTASAPTPTPATPPAPPAA